MNSDRRNVWGSQESHSLPSTSQAYRLSEFVPSNPVHHERLPYPQENSELYKNTMKEEHLQQRTALHLQENTHSNLGLLYLPHPEVKNLGCVSQNLGNCQIFPLENENASDFRVSSQQNSFDSSGSLDFSESQVIEMRQLVGDIGYNNPHSNDGRSSYWGHPQERNASTTPSTGELLQDTCTSRESFYLRKSDLNPEINNANTFHIGCSNEYSISENNYSSAFSSPCLGNNFHFNQQYLPDCNIEHSAQQHNSNRQNSEKGYETFNEHASLPRIADFEQSKHIPTGYCNQDCQVSTAQWQSSPRGDYPNLGDRSIKNSSFPNRYLLNSHQPKNQQHRLQSNNPINSVQVYEENRLISQKFSDEFKFQQYLPRFPDHRPSRHIQPSSKKPGYQQSSTYVSGKSICLKNNHTSVPAKIPKYETTSDISKSMNFGFKSNQWLNSHHPDETRDPFTNEDHMNEERTYEQQTHKLSFSHSSATKNNNFPLSASSVIINQRDKGNFPKNFSLKSSNQQNVNLDRCFIPPNGDRNETVSANNNANIHQGYSYVSNSSPENFHSKKNLNVDKNLKLETSMRLPLAYPQYRNSSSRDQNEQIPPRINSISKPFRCNVCAKRFQYKCRLTRHRRTHTDERPFACNMCSNSFKQRCHLVEHKRIHTKERPYECNICNKSFTQYSILHRHMQIHKNERPF